MSRKVNVVVQKRGCMYYTLVILAALLIIGVVASILGVIAAIALGFGLWFIIRYVWRSYVRERPDSAMVQRGLKMAPITRKVLAGALCVFVTLIAVAVASTPTSQQNAPSSSAPQSQEQEQAQQPDQHQEQAPEKPEQGGSSSQPEQGGANASQQPGSDSSPTLASADDPWATVNAFVAQYNSTHEVQITDTVQYDPHEQHENSGPYSRTEFRLPAYTKSVGLHGSIGDDSIDLVSFGALGDYSDFRIYLYQPDNDWKQAIQYAQDFNDASFAIAGYTVTEDHRAEYDEGWDRFVSATFDSDGTGRSGASLHFNDLPTTVSVTVMPGAGLLADYSLQ